jgi:hypothetical protein
MVHRGASDADQAVDACSNQRSSVVGSAHASMRASGDLLREWVKNLGHRR